MPGEREERAIELLESAAGQFRYYEQQHRAKGTSEADAKAVVNAGFAEQIEAFLASPPAETHDAGEVGRLRAALEGCRISLDRMFNEKGQASLYAHTMPAWVKRMRLIIDGALTRRPTMPAPEQPAQPASFPLADVEERERLLAALRHADTYFSNRSSSLCITMRATAEHVRQALTEARSKTATSPAVPLAKEVVEGGQ